MMFQKKQLNCKHEIRLYHNIRGAPSYKNFNGKGKKHREMMIISHLKLVAKIARKFKSSSLSFSDLMSEGTIGLIEAVDRFDIKKGTSLASYASLWIRSAIHSAILKNKSIVRIGTNAKEKKLFYSLSKMSHLKNSEIAEKLNISIELIEITKERILNSDYSLNNLCDENMEFIDKILSNDQSPEERLVEKEEDKQIKIDINKALSLLDVREKEIIKVRKMDENPINLKDLSNIYNISSERVRQIELKALEKMKACLSN